MIESPVSPDVLRDIAGQARPRTIHNVGIGSIPWLYLQIIMSPDEPQEWPSACAASPHNHERRTRPLLAGGVPRLDDGVGLLRGECSTQARKDCLRFAHHPFDHLARRPDIIHQPDALPHQPRHLFPVSLGLRRGQEHVELTHLDWLAVQHRPADDSPGPRVPSALRQGGRCTPRRHGCAANASG